MITNVRSEILRRVCTEGFICNGDKFETYSAVNEQSHILMECYRISHITSHSVHPEVTSILFITSHSVHPEVTYILFAALSSMQH